MKGRELKGGFWDLFGDLLVTWFLGSVAHGLGACFDHRYKSLGIFLLLSLFLVDEFRSLE